MELVQAGHHLFRGTYLAHPSRFKIGPLVFLVSLWDRGMRQAARNWLAAVRERPTRLLDRLYAQTIDVIQISDVHRKGQSDIRCRYPDMTVWNGALVNSCRLDEHRLLGQLHRVTEQHKSYGGTS